MHMEMITCETRVIVDFITPCEFCMPYEYYTCSSYGVNYIRLIRTCDLCLAVKAIFQVRLLLWSYNLRGKSSAIAIECKK